MTPISPRNQTLLTVFPELITFTSIETRINNATNDYCHGDGLSGARPFFSNWDESAGSPRPSGSWRRGGAARGRSARTAGPGARAAHSPELQAGHSRAPEEAGRRRLVVGSSHV